MSKVVVVTRVEGAYDFNPEPGKEFQGTWRIVSYDPIETDDPPFVELTFFGNEDDLAKRGGLGFVYGIDRALKAARSRFQAEPSLGEGRKSFGKEELFSVVRYLDGRESFLLEANRLLEGNGPTGEKELFSILKEIL